MPSDCEKCGKKYIAAEKSYVQMEWDVCDICAEKIERLVEDWLAPSPKPHSIPKGVFDSLEEPTPSLRGVFQPAYPHLPESKFTNEIGGEPLTKPTPSTPINPMANYGRSQLSDKSDNPSHESNPFDIFEKSHLMSKEPTPRGVFQPAYPHLPESKFTNEIGGEPLTKPTPSHQDTIDKGLEEHCFPPEQTPAPSKANHAVNWFELFDRVEALEAQQNDWKDEVSQLFTMDIVKQFDELKTTVAHLNEKKVDGDVYNRLHDLVDKLKCCGNCFHIGQAETCLHDDTSINLPEPRICEKWERRPQ